MYYERETKGRKMAKKTIVGALIAALLLAACGEPEYASYDLGGSGTGIGQSAVPGGDGGQSSTGTNGTGADGTNGGTGSIFGNQGDGGYVINEGPNTTAQLTEADIQAMNNNRAVIIRSNNGYVSTLVGRYYDRQIPIVPGDISTFEAAINSLDGIASLLGLQAGTEFFADTGAQDKEGYTYLTYRQKYAGNVVENATMHIVLDPQGYTAAVSCSFTPGLGIQESGDGISAEEAVTVAGQVIAQCGYDVQIYPEYTAKVAVPLSIRVVNCYVVMCDNPEKDSSFEAMQYMKIYISTDGDFIMALPTSTLNVVPDTNYYPTDEYFQGLQPMVYNGTVNFRNIGSRQVSISVAYNPDDGLYYMVDLARKIAIADYNSFMNQGYQVAFLTSPDNTWDERDVAAMYNYAAAYDAYASIGIKSPDGFETPVLALRHWEENGQPVNNAVFIDYLMGWYVFGYSEANDYCYDLDAMGHEYTHAVTLSTIQGSNYQNDAGAVNEAYSDVMGNLIEMMAGRTVDTTWKLAENSNETLRSMSSPYEYNQPYAIGDLYYVPNTSVPNAMLNDGGGVHTNSSIINYAAYLLNQNGMDYKTEFDLFYTSLQLLTPANTFQDVYAALIYSARSNGYTQYEDMITQVFNLNGVLAEDRAAQENSYRVNGCGRVVFQVNTDLEKTYGCTVKFINPATGGGVMTWPGKNGVVSALLPVGNYFYVEFDIVDINSGQGAAVVMGQNGWTNQPTGASVIAVQEGQTLTLPNIN